MPPPVLPGAAPINIRSIVSSLPPSEREAISTVLKPAVLGVTEWKKAERKRFSRVH
jgi:hypothetical protein